MSEKEPQEETREGTEGTDQTTPAETTEPTTEPATAVATEEKPGEGVPPAPELTLEQVQATPFFQDVQGRHDRMKNLLRDSETSGAETRQQLAKFRRERDEEVLTTLGDTPEVRDLVARLRHAEELEGNLAVRESKVTNLEHEGLVRELAQEYGIDPEALRTADVKDSVEMEAYAKALKSVAGTAQGGPKAKVPALTHQPDAALTTSSAAALSEAAIKDAYIAGDIERPEYETRMAKIGKQP